MNYRRLTRSLLSLDNGTVMVFLVFLAIVIVLTWEYVTILERKPNILFIASAAFLAVAYDMVKQVMRKYDKLAKAADRETPGGSHATIT